ncbi:MAG: CDP-diacylglycerol--glycerol-3-phosphate 3-phosphatidyltransferase [Candidatus Kapabacteria bacterium]|nr:CDP-diacylglycerol--glycerol-3-phosphate 3-phosphatidyltransferase [Candidatus Kapabacteria bacterium]
MKTDAIFTIANIFTSLRILLAPVFFYCLIEGSHLNTRIAIALFIVAALTDYIDGVLARKFGEISAIGQFLDPLADKVLVLSAFLAFVFMGIIPMWIVVIIILRDVGTTLMRIIAESKGFDMKTSRSAKWKTAIQMMFISVILAVIGIQRSPEIPAFAALAHEYLFSATTMTFALIVCVITVWTLVEYCLDNSALFKRN